MVDERTPRYWYVTVGDIAPNAVTSNTVVAVITHVFPILFHTRTRAPTEKIVIRVAIRRQRSRNSFQRKFNFTEDKGTMKTMEYARLTLFDIEFGVRSNIYNLNE